MFGGGGNFKMSNYLVSIVLLLAFLIQTRARYKRIFNQFLRGWIKSKDNFKDGNYFVFWNRSSYLYI